MTNEIERLTVKDLIKHLEQYPSEMEIINTRFSDYKFMELSDWSVVDALEQNGREWLRRVYSSSEEEIKTKAKKYLHLEGN